MVKVLDQNLSTDGEIWKRIPFCTQMNVFKQKLRPVSPFSTKLHMRGA